MYTLRKQVFRKTMQKTTKLSAVSVVVLFVTCSLFAWPVSLLLADQPVSDDAGTPRLWQDNRITQKQPFPARVLEVVPSWIGYSMLLEEITEGEPRYCIAKLWSTDELGYTIVKDRAEFKNVPGGHKAILLNPGVTVNDFRWDSRKHGGLPIGPDLGENDFVARNYANWLKQAATAKLPKHSYRLTQAERGAESVTIIEGGPDAVTFDITSKSGIGRLVITPLASEPSKRGAWSTRVTLRLHLKQLAFIQLDNGKHTITSESLRGPKPRATYVTPSGNQSSSDRRPK